MQKQEQMQKQMQEQKQKQVTQRRRQSPEPRKIGFRSDASLKCYILIYSMSIRHADSCLLAPASGPDTEPL